MQGGPVGRPSHHTRTPVNGVSGTHRGPSRECQNPPGSAAGGQQPERHEQEHQQAAGERHPLHARFLLSAPEREAVHGRERRTSGCSRDGPRATARAGSRFIIHDVTWIATSRYVAAMPHATAPGRHGDANGTNSSRAAEVHEVVGPQREHVHADEHDRQVSRGTCAGRAATPGTPLRRMSRVDSARPHRMLSGDDRPRDESRRRAAAYHESFAFNSREQRAPVTCCDPVSSTLPVVEEHPGVDARGRARGRAPASAPRDDDRTSRFPPPTTRRARRRRPRRRRSRAESPVAGSMRWWYRRPPRVHARMRVVLVTIAPSASGKRNATRVSSNGIEHGNVPRAVGRRFAAGAQVAAHADERGPRAPRSTRPRATRSAARPLPTPPRSRRVSAGCARASAPRRSRPARSRAPRRGSARRRCGARAAIELEGAVVAGVLERVEDRRIESAGGGAVQIGRAREREQHRRELTSVHVAGAARSGGELAVGTEPAPTLFEPFELARRPSRRRRRARRPTTTCARLPIARTSRSDQYVSRGSTRSTPDHGHCVPLHAGGAGGGGVVTTVGGGVRRARGAGAGGARRTPAWARPRWNGGRGREPRRVCPHSVHWWPGDPPRGGVARGLLVAARDRSTGPGRRTRCGARTSRSPWCAATRERVVQLREPGRAAATGLGVF